MTPARPVTVRVACSTSNLGPGFDCLGLALALWLEATAHPRPAGADAARQRIERRGQAAGWPEHDDLFLEAFALAAREGGGAPAVDLDLCSEIPVGRGFGSSGAAVAAGLLLGAALAPGELPLARLHALGVALEGHPDNVTASLHGGLTLCHPYAGGGEGGEGRPLLVHSAVSARLGFVLAWTDQTLTTAEARRVLPRTVAFADAVENARRLPLLLAGLRDADRALVSAGGEDRLHVPCRLPLIAGGAQALAAAREAGAWLATISGAGSGLVAVAPRETCEAVAAALRAALARHAAGATARVLEAVREAPRVRHAEPWDGA